MFSGHGFLIGILVLINRLLPSRDQFIHHLRLGQCGGVSKLIYGTFGDLPQYPPHDLPTSGLGKGRGKMEFVRACNRTDFTPDVANKGLFEFI